VIKAEPTPKPTPEKKICHGDAQADAENTSSYAISDTATTCNQPPMG
jgi:hypothetical protein